MIIYNNERDEKRKIQPNTQEKKRTNKIDPNQVESFFF